MCLKWLFLFILLSSYHYVWRSVCIRLVWKGLLLMGTCWLELPVLIVREISGWIPGPIQWDSFWWEFLPINLEVELSQSSSLTIVIIFLNVFELQWVTQKRLWMSVLLLLWYYCSYILLQWKNSVSSSIYTFFLSRYRNMNWSVANKSKGNQSSDRVILKAKGLLFGVTFFLFSLPIHYRPWISLCCVVGASKMNCCFI